tara:strand:- start:276 stop:551 length:276 start_codon:yes stop_codon:yes gene_type:complete
MAEENEPKELTADEIATIFTLAGESKLMIDKYETKPHDWTTAFWKKRISSQVFHLEYIKSKKKLDGTTSVWTTEDFTAIDAAIAKGKSLIA